MVPARGLNPGRRPGSCHRRARNRLLYERLLLPLFRLRDVISPKQFGRDNDQPLLGELEEADVEEPSATKAVNYNILLLLRLSWARFIRIRLDRERAAPTYVDLEVKS